MMQNGTPINPDQIILFGPWETLPLNSSTYNFIIRKITNPLDISFPEAPAGFQNNSEKVAKNVADFIEWRLLNYYRLAVLFLPVQ